MFDIWRLGGASPAYPTPESKIAFALIVRFPLFDFCFRFGCGCLHESCIGEMVSLRLDFQKRLSFVFVQLFVV